jgi:hypothetical protein
MIKSILAATGIAVTTIAVALAVTASAGHTTDNQYLGKLSQQGINGDPGALIATGHQICRVWYTSGPLRLPDRSAHPLGLSGEKRHVEQKLGLNDAQATSLMWDAIGAYC